MKFAVVVFPGSVESRCAQTEHVLGQQAELIWHKDTSLRGADAVILPGGFAHGDYLRTGAIARFSPIMLEVTVCGCGRPCSGSATIPGASRGRHAARRDAAQREPAFSLRARVRKWSKPIRRSRARARPSVR